MEGLYEDFRKYSGLLDEQQLLNLFDLVRSEAGSVSEAARRCGIERKTIYDMMSKGNQVKISTKKRILKAALMADFEKSAELLLAKVVKNSEEILFNYLSLVYQKTMRAKDAGEFTKATSRLEFILNRYAGLAVGSLQEELGSMESQLAERGARLGVKYDPPRLRLIETSRLEVTIPALMKGLLMAPKIDSLALANKWRLDPSVVISASKMVNEYRTKVALEVQRPMIEPKLWMPTKPSSPKGLLTIPPSSSSIERVEDVTTRALEWRTIPNLEV